LVLLSGSYSLPLSRFRRGPVKKRNLLLATSAAAVAFLGCSSTEVPSESAESGPSALLIAHRGASAYAPEHTVAAYELAIEQGADFIEPDLQITKDGVLIALHDLTLERTTNVEDVFPDRAQERLIRGQPTQVWPVSEFTLEEVRTLDAGSWFGEAFTGARVPTFKEVIELSRGRAGLIPETKAPEVYGELGFDMERLVVAELAEHGLDRPGADAATPVILQSFSAESLNVLRNELGSELPSTFLVSGPDAADWLSPDGLARIKGFATGIGPARNLLLEIPGVVEAAHLAGLTVIPYTFRQGSPGDSSSVEEEMTYFIYTLGVDGLFTNNPDLFPRTPPQPGR
jgi:glycerophosphoryl diester phosphodiesterase